MAAIAMRTGRDAAMLSAGRRRSRISTTSIRRVHNGGKAFAGKVLNVLLREKAIVRPGVPSEDSRVRDRCSRPPSGYSAFQCTPHRSGHSRFRISASRALGFATCCNQIHHYNQRKILKLRRSTFERSMVRLDPFTNRHAYGAAVHVDADRYNADLPGGCHEEHAGVAADIEHAAALEGLRDRRCRWSLWKI